MIAITGSKGTLGRLLISKLSKYKLQYIEYQGDILNKKLLNSWIRDNDFDFLFHFAAIAPIEKVEKNRDKSFKVNVLGINNLMNSLIYYRKSPWIFYSSTSHIYKYSKNKLSESSIVQPINYYGYTKYLGEVIFDYYRSNHNFKICTARIFSFYHSSQKETFLYPSLLKKIKNMNKDVIELHGSKNIRDISKAEDIVEFIFKLYKKKYSGVVNIGSGNQLSVGDFAKKLSNKKNIKFIDNDKNKPNKILANISKIKKLTKN
jgi:nucleoside-diphosphate-sugar epimerase